MDLFHEKTVPYHSVLFRTIPSCSLLFRRVRQGASRDQGVNSIESKTVKGSIVREDDIFLNMFFLIFVGVRD